LNADFEFKADSARILSVAELSSMLLQFATPTTNYLSVKHILLNRASSL
jgi:hypothetical protein